MINQPILEMVRAEFDENWYQSTYSKDLDELSLADERAFDFYLRAGARLGHDPNRSFSELVYRNNNRDVYEHLLIHRQDFGFRHYVEHGRHEPARASLPPKHIELYRQIYLRVERKFIESNFTVNDEIYISTHDFYYSEARRQEISPSEWFSEPAYRQLNPDVKNLVESENVLSGFAHFISTMQTEQRASMTIGEYEKFKKSEQLSKIKSALDSNLPGVASPTAIELIEHLRFYTDPITVRVEQDSSIPGLLVIVPNYLPEILFGGYKAFFSFLRNFKSRTRADLRLLVANNISDENHRWNVLRMRIQEPQEADMFSNIAKFTTEREVIIPGNYRVISYSAETHYIASTISQTLGSTPFFFIQDYEPDFHAEGDVKTFTKNAFFAPHRGIYNSEKLVDFFKKKTDIFSKQGQQYRYSFIENYIELPRKSASELISLNERKRVKTLIFYGRPEGHAARNNFATFVLGLRKAAKDGVFDGQAWDFISVGSLCYEGSMEITDGLKLKIVSKMPYQEYIDLVESGDVGVSFISTPHPGIVHFQMAAYGLTTITNTTELRTAEWLRSVNENLIGVDLVPAAIAEGLRAAVAKSEDLTGRFSRASKAQTITKAACTSAALEFLAAEIKAPDTPDNTLNLLR